MKDDPRNRIPSEQLTAYERWELPLLDQQGNEVVREEEREVKPLTAADLEEIRQAAWEDGHAEGKAEGLQAGHAEGLEKGHQEGLAQGLAEGRSQGHEEALAQTREDVEGRLERLQQLLGELLVPIQRHEDELETALVNLTTVLARAVIYRELAMDSSHIQAVVQRAMASLPSTSENVRLLVNPADAEWVAQVASQYDAGAAIVEDTSILPGGCKLETRHSLVDFTVEKRFQKAVQSMLDQQLDSDDPGDSAELDAMMGDLTDFHRDVLSTPGTQGDDSDNVPD
ncbi:flagellar assembly protein FliH [Marinobacter zhejiangensis]|uniref:Flagellar assembly protein FliH n=1 Tax=Marinobacter zhejiangensis TaxID=488535 RepID=A0A1I4NNS5_9GAMM|nr:flagellar assembly protein FliH [Marinobacter zhejiangensis]SFM17000.1 flagellar assembly protein FliH [Marinobacter zhejiangensis]